MLRVQRNRGAKFNERGGDEVHGRGFIDEMKYFGRCDGRKESR